MHLLSEEYLTTSNPLGQIQNCYTQPKKLPDGILYQEKSLCTKKNRNYPC